MSKRRRPLQRAQTVFHRADTRRGRSRGPGSSAPPSNSRRVSHGPLGYPGKLVAERLCRAWRASSGRSWQGRRPLRTCHIKRGQMIGADFEPSPRAGSHDRHSLTVFQEIGQLQRTAKRIKRAASSSNVLAGNVGCAEDTTDVVSRIVRFGGLMETSSNGRTLCASGAAWGAVLRRG